MLGRLISEEMRERGLRDSTGNVPQYTPVLDVLTKAIESLPPDVPLRVRQLDLAGDASVIVGEARSHGEVEQIAAALAKVKGLTVKPARTERTRRGPVRFTIRFETGVDGA